MNLALQQIQQMKSYNPPLEERSKFNGLRLDFNERLAPLPKNVLKSLRKIESKTLMSYPAYGDLPDKIATYAGVKIQNLLITNGSDQGMELIFRTFVSDGDEVLIPSPSFAMFYQVAQIQGAKIVKVQYAKNGSFPLAEVLCLLKKKPKLLVVCNPNNPTGSVLSLENIEKILKTAKQTIVYLDEAYFEFCDVTAVKFVEQYPNLFITRTFSKAFGLGGLRIGYLLSSEKNIEEMKKVRGPYDVNQIAKIAASESLESLNDMRAYCSEVMKIAKPMVEKFFRENQILFLPSRANFLYFKEPFIGFTKKMAKKGILIRLQSDGYARVTIGTAKQMRLFIEICKNCLLN